MQHRSARGAILTFFLILTTMLSSFPSVQPTVSARRESASAEPAQTPPLDALCARLSQTIGQIYLPLITTGGTAAATTQTIVPAPSQAPDTPGFVMSSPTDGMTVAGTTYIAIQPVGATNLACAAFRAGTTFLGSDLTPEDGLQVFLDSRTLSPGTRTLTATAIDDTGTQISASVDVTILAAAPAGATVGPAGTTIGTESGSTVTVPAGAVDGTASVSVVEKTQQQVTDETGIDWDNLGVTFLGALDVTSDQPFQRPLGVSSVGFANRIQPGQAVVTYNLLPDRDGDGIGELSVVNAAEVAPNGTIVSPPLPGITIAGMTVEQAGATLSQAKGISGPPGTPIEFRGSGFNPLSAQGNIAIFRSQVDGTELRIPAPVFFEDGTIATLRTMIPPLPPGPATLSLLNASTGGTYGPLAVTVEEIPAVVRPADAIIDDTLADTVAALNDLRGEESAASLVQSINRMIADIGDLRAEIQALRVDPSPEEATFLTTFAGMIETSGVINQLTPDGMPQLSQQQCPERGPVKDMLTALGLLGGIMASLGLAGISSAAEGTLLLALSGFSLGVGVFIVLLVATVLFFIGYQDYENGCPQPPQCPPTQPGPVGAPALQGGITPAQTGSTIVGMGSAPPPGGNGCGNLMAPPAGGDGDTTLQQADSGFDPGRYTIKVYPRGQTSGVSLSQFTGLLDAGGYFFVPFIPEGEPFTAAAYDNVSGRVETFEGVGPPLGESALMFFDFTGEAEEEQVYPINIGDTVSNGVPAEGAGNIELPGGADVYRFTADPRQYVLFEIEEIDTSLGRERTTWKLEDEQGRVIFDAVFRSDRDVGPLLLMPGGTYTLTVQANEEALGAYRITLLDFPQQDRFDITLNDEISDGVPGVGAGNLETLGAKDIYFFEAPAGQHIFIDVQEWNTPQRTGQQWDLVAPDGTLLIDRSPLSEGGQRGPITLSQTGTYAVIVGTRRSGDATGTYRIQVWDVPPPDVFTISLDDTISNGMPGPGAGNLETPGVQDIYTFTGSSGQQVFFDELEHVGGQQWSLAAPDGTLLIDRLDLFDRGPIPLPETGTYTLTVLPAINNDLTGSYSFQLWEVPPPDAFAISIGDTVAEDVPGPGAGNIESPGVQDIYTFAGNSGQQVFFNLLEYVNLRSQHWNLAAPNGTLVVGDTSFTNDHRGPITLPETGTYTLTVGVREDSANVSSYRFKLWEVPPPDAFAISLGDTISNGVPGPGAGNIESPGVRDIYTFAGSSGQEIIFDVLEATGQNWNLVAPDDTLLIDRSAFVDRTITLPQTGTYTLIAGTRANLPVTGTYSFQLTTP